MALPALLIPILASAIAGGVGSGVSAYQGSRANQRQAQGAQRQRREIRGATREMDAASRALGATRGDYRRAMSRLDPAQDMLAGADEGLVNLLRQLGQHMQSVRNTDVTSGATDAITRQQGATAAARGISGSGAANANVAGALARVNAEDQGRQQELIAQLLGMMGDTNMGRGQLAGQQGQLASVHGQLAQGLGNVAIGQGNLAAQKGQLFGHEAFAQPDPGSFNPMMDAIGGFLGGALGGGAGAIGSQLSTPFGMQEWMNMFDMNKQLTPQQVQFNQSYNPFQPRSGGMNNNRVNVTPNVTSNVGSIPLTGGGGFRPGGGFGRNPARLTY